MPRRFSLRILAVLGALLAASASPLGALTPDLALTQYVHRIWQLQQGLPQPTVNAICQSGDGYMWLGTQRGLVRFDGVRFTVIDQVGDLSLANIWVRDLQEDSQHALWIGTPDKGVYRLKNGKAEHFSIADGLPADDVRDLQIDHQGNLWVATAAGLAEFAGGKFVPANPPGGAAQPTFCVAAAKTGEIWFSPGGRVLVERNGAHDTLHTLSTLAGYASVQALLCADDGAIWAGSNVGLVRMKDGQEELFTTANGLADNAVYCLLQNRDGTIWAGTKDGFSRFRGDASHGSEFESFHARDGLSQSTVYALCEDREGSLWVGTKHGLNQFLDRRTIPFTESEGLASNDTGPVYQDRLGNIWIGTVGKGLCRFEGHGFTTITTAQGLASDSIYTLLDDNAGDLWVGTDKGLSRLHAGNVVQTITRAQGLPSDFIRCLLRDSSGALWIGTAAGPAVLRDGVITLPQVSESLRTPVLAMIEHKGDVFLSSQGGGVCRFDKGQFTELKDGSSELRDVDAFFEDSEGLLWIGTLGGGLRVLQGDRFTSFSVKDGLYDNDIYGIVAGEGDRLWFACSRGTFSVSRVDLLKFAAGSIKTFVSQPLSPTDALRIVECKSGVQPAAYRSSDGRLWFSTIRGVNVVESARLQRKLIAPPVVIEEVLVNGRSTTPDERTGLPPGSSNLEFRYTALSLVAPTRMSFRYQLQGFDKEWIDAGNRREAFYTNLPPGNYTFQVKAGNIDGTWSTDPASVSFTMDPHIYQQSWFIPAVAALVIIVIWAIVRLRISGVRRRMQVILTERSRIARELHDTLLQGFSGVTMELQALSAQLQTPRERSRLQEIIRDAANSLTEARRSVAGLRNATQPASLSASIEQSARQLTEATDFRLKLSLQPISTARSPEVDYNILRIVSEAISNAVKHSRGATIEVAMRRVGDSLQLSVHDDGTGFEAGNGNGPRQGHYGLIGIRERVAQIGGHLELNSAPGQGTSVRVNLPARSTEVAAGAVKGEAV